MSDPVLVAGDIAVTIAAAGSLLFVGVYAAAAPWYRSLVGWSVMLLAFALGAISTLVSVSRWIGTEWPGREPVRLLVFSLAGCAVWGLLATLLAGQANGRRARKRKRGGPS